MAKFNSNDYIGLTYPGFLGWKPLRKLWQRFMCPLCRIETIEWPRTLLD